MSEQLQLRRGTAAQIAANTPAAGEAWVDTDHNRLVVGDGSTVGGFAVPKMSEVASYAVLAKAVSANLVTDTPLVVLLPPGVTRYRVTRVTALAPSVSLTAAQAAVYTAASAGGTAICSPQALSGLTSSSPGVAGNAIDLTLALAAATFFTATTLYFRISTAQGAAATFDVILHIQPYD
jgi:Major tropism determinant N-terminal domain